MIDKFNLNNKIHYHGNIEPAALSLEFTKYHLLILPRPLNKQAKFGLSTKLSEYLVSGVPTLVTAVSDNAIFIKDNYNGFIIAPGSLPEMVTKIIEIIDNYNLNSYQIARNAFRLAQEEFDYKLFTNTLIEFFFNKAAN
jgi:glycosyltransferase involved in cell wall biosynthesis